MYRVSPVARGPSLLLLLLLLLPGTEAREIDSGRRAAQWPHLRHCAEEAFACVLGASLTSGYPLDYWVCTRLPGLRLCHLSWDKTGATGAEPRHSLELSSPAHLYSQPSHTPPTRPHLSLLDCCCANRDSAASPPVGVCNLDARNPGSIHLNRTLDTRRTTALRPSPP